MNVPNSITLTRLLMIPVIVFFYMADFIPYGRLVAALLFVVASLTDFLDGFIARKYNKVTTLGKFFDSIADKVLVMAGFLLIVAGPIFGSAPVVYPSWLGVVCIIIILAREFIISALRQLAAAKGVVLAADMGGKVKATAQYFIITFYMILAFVETDLLNEAGKSSTAMAIIRFVLMILLIATTFLTIYTGASYILRNTKVFKDTQEENVIENSKIENENENVKETENKVEEN